MNNILIPTDFSEHSNYAFEYASFLSKKKGGKLIIVHILRNSNNIDNVNEKFKEIKSSNYLEGVDFDFRIIKGQNVSKLISKTAVDCNADLIVMGSKGNSNIGAMFLGSNTENVVRNSKSNILTVKHKMLGPNLDSILFSSDFSQEAYTIFETVLGFSNLFNAEIHFLSVNNSKKETKEELEEKMNRFADFFNLSKNKYKIAICENKNQEFGIINYAIDNDIDLISIGSHGRKILHKRMHESVSRKLVKDTFRPILTMKFP